MESLLEEKLKSILNRIFFIYKSIIFCFALTSSLCANAQEKKIENANDYVEYLKVNTNPDTIIVYTERCVGCAKHFENVYVAYEKHNRYYMSVFKTGEKVKRDLLISKGIFTIRQVNFYEIIKCLKVQGDPTTIITNTPVGSFVKKLGSSHGRSYSFKIIIDSNDISKEYCCGLSPNGFFIDGAYPLWLLMSSIILEIR